MNNNQSSSGHLPVMLDSVLDVMAPHDGGLYLDGTFGAGGYSRAILNRASCRVCALDRDETVRPFADKLARDYVGRFTFLFGRFGALADITGADGFSDFDGVVMDIGVSSMQLDEGARGFSFVHDGPLDMRMDRSTGQTAADIVNQEKQDALADLIYEYGEERKSRKIAAAIVRRREEKPFERTGELAECVASVMPRSKDGKHPATRTFQALRIAVNDELGELRSGLQQAAGLLKAGGRLVVVTFHSLEDRIVKQFFQELTGSVPGVSRYMPLPQAQKGAPSFDMLTSKALKPSAAEVEVNPRARSAKLRAVRKKEGGS